MNLLNLSILTVTALTSVSFGGGDLTPLGPVAEVGSYAGQAMDIKDNLAAIGHKVDGSYAIQFYAHTPLGWNVVETADIGTRRATSLAFGEGVLGVSLSGIGAAGVVLEPSRSGWSVTAQLSNPDIGRFSSFELAAASDEAFLEQNRDKKQVTLSRVE